ncbi:Uncharacterised protein [BD1-7 clade bacterium]|uniref:O-antigen ligase-related domain-containing protein n=1 Tax=BD1-7 clade bacterium TaxID=2029982 RepID=A0A5S9P9B1_9GAMM|nr:Uncharacterised protein [BD1-7 clade bacterium]CAA0101113.1 Uncharacterised protein [BD1-7 clade bacterium]
MTQPASFQIRFGNKDDAFRALLLCTIFFNFVCGSLFMLLVNSLIQVVFAFGVLIAYRKHQLNLLAGFRQAYPIAFYLLIAWLCWTFLSLGRVLLFDNELKSQIALAIIRQFYFVTAICFVIALIKYMRITGMQYSVLFNTMAAGLLATLAYLLVSFHFGPTPQSKFWFLGLPLAGHIRVISSVGGPVMLICAVYLLMYRSINTPRAFATISVLIAGWSAIFWTGGRTGMSAAILATLILVIFSGVFQRRTIKRVPALVFCIVCGFFIADQLSVFSWNGLGRTVDTIKAVSEAPESIAAQSTGRAYMWEVSLNAAMAHPVFGLGPSGYVFIPERPFGTDPHNFLIQFLVEWGFPGTILIITLMLHALVHGVRQLPTAFRENDLTYISGAAIVLVLSLYGITGSSYFHLQPLLYLLIGYSIFPYSRPTAS